MNKEKIGLWGGSFNPVSNIHINLATNLILDLNLDKIFFVPVGNYYPKENLEKAYHRYNMLKLATQNIDKLEVEDIEINSKTKLYAKDAFSMLSKKYSNLDIYFIMGSDNFLKMPNWKNYEELIDNYKFIIINRKNYEISEIFKQNIIYYTPKVLETVDSTKIRELIEKKKNIEEYIDKNVYKYIQKNRLYKK